MRTIEAAAMADLNRGKPMMVFDWDKAARIIRERKATTASAGLAQDWEWTGGEILTDGKPTPEDDTYVYLASNWATPELDIDGEVMPCYRMQDGSGWDSKTYWPESALAILNGQSA
jgi:hypothetical protein